MSTNADGRLAAVRAKARREALDAAIELIRFESRGLWSRTPHFNSGLARAACIVTELRDKLDDELYDTRSSASRQHYIDTGEYLPRQD